MMNKTAKREVKQNHFYARMDILGILYIITSLFLTGAGGAVRAQAADNNCQYFKETGYETCGLFNEYWKANGGLARQGFPVSAEFDEEQAPPPAGDGLVHRVQYFQRARFEYHSENKPPYNVLLGLVGTEQYNTKYADNPPAFLEPLSGDCQYFPETRLKACGKFLEYWQQNGGLAQQGLPISEEFEEQNAPPPAGDGKIHRVQYFQRARFEYHPENQPPYQVLSGLLGAEQYKARYGIGGPTPPATFATLYPALDRLGDEVNEVRLEDDWDGMSMIAPLVAHYTLERLNNGFEGEAVFGAGSRDNGGLETSRKIAIPLSEMQKFLKLLGNAPVKEGKYEPHIDHTDDYPYRSIALETPGGPLKIYSSSQGRDNIPWGASYAGKTFVLQSDTPARAFDVLEPYLARDVQKELINRAEKDPEPELPALPPPGQEPLKGPPLSNIYSVLAEPGHTGEVYGLTYSPNGKLFASGGNASDRTIRLWDNRGNLVKVIQTGHREVMSLAFSPDSKTLAAGFADDTIQLWDAGSGNLLPTNFKPVDGAKNNTESIEALAFTPDGKHLISGEGIFGRWVVIWDVALGQALKVYEGTSFSVTADGKTLVYLPRFEDGLRLVDLANNQVRTIFAELKQAADLIALSSDGKTLAVSQRAASRDAKPGVLLIDMATGQKLHTLSVAGNFLFSLVFSPDGKLLASADFMGSQTQLWDVASGQLQTTLESQGRFGYQMSFRPDGQTLLTGGDSITNWKLDSGQIDFNIEKNYSQVEALALSPDKARVATATNGGEVKLWNSADGKLQTVLKANQNTELKSVGFSPDGKLVAAAGGNEHYNENHVKVWEVASGKEVVTISGHSGPVEALAFSPDGKSLFSASSDRTVRQWEIPSGKRLATFKGLPPDFFEFYALAVSPDGQRVAAAGSGNSERSYYPIKVWEVKTGRELANLTGHTLPVRSLAFSPDGSQLASGGNDQTVRLWNIASGQALKVMSVDTRTVNGEKARASWGLEGTNTGTVSVVFSPDGQTLATAHPNGYLRLWRVASGEELSVTAVQSIPGNFYIAYGGDGKTIFSGHYLDSTLGRWSVR
ncbi:MAG TPA: WD40 repeat domain-containing protein [Chloroflexia bacterium]|nr:WD40 repeat domain-containing protein [Chloroflexia bacterium]